MKKFITILLSVLMVCCITACSKQEPGSDVPSNTDTNTNTNTDTNSSTADVSYWQGNWYGWWTPAAGTGIYEDMGKKGIAFDAFMNVETYEDGTGYLYLWDTESSKGFPLVKADFILDGKKMNITDGSFFAGGDWLDQFNVEEVALEDGLVIDPDNSTVSKFDHMIELTGNYLDSNGNSFVYYFYLKPWGAKWDDVKNGDTSGCIFKDMMSIYYDNWYTSLLYLNEDLPDTFKQGIDIINAYLEAQENGGSNSGQTTTSDLGEKEGATGEVTLEKLKEVLPFLKANGGRSYDTTYDEIAAKFGVHGKKINQVDKNVWYRWLSDDNNRITVTFTIGDDGIERWNATAWDGIE